MPAIEGTLQAVLETLQDTDYIYIWDRTWRVHGYRHEVISALNDHKSRFDRDLFTKDICDLKESEYNDVTGGKAKHIYMYKIS
jgi:hypothetical protein